MQVLVKESSAITEVYRTDKGGVYQCDTERCWYVDFGGKLARFDHRNLMKLRKAVYNVNIEALLLDSAKAPDLEIIFICACDHCYVLTLLQIIELKEILQGTFVMLELNSIINQRIGYPCN